MLMKWTDLEAGDIIKLKDEVARALEFSYSSFVKEWCCKKLVVINIYYDYNNPRLKEFEIGISVKNEVGHLHTFIINKEYGTVDWSNFSGVPFEIVKLKED